MHGVKSLFKANRAEIMKAFVDISFALNALANQKPLQSLKHHGCKRA